MDELFATGRIVDLILGVMVIETAALAGYHKLTRRGIRIIPLLANMGAGAGLLLALRIALTQAGWSLMCGVLSLAFAMHLLDLWSRWNVILLPQATKAESGLKQPLREMPR